MHSHRLALCAVLTGWLAVGGLRAADGPLMITYIANDGFLLSHDGKKVLIDALFGQGQDLPYGDVPSLELLAQMEQARAPFDGVNVVLVTHPHYDHFSAKSVAAHLAQNPRAVFLSTRDAVEQVRRISPGLEAGGRIRAATPERMRTSRTENVGGIRIDALWVDHGKPDFENLSFVVRWNGVGVLHTGDNANPEDYRSFQWDDAGLDVAVVSPPFFFRGSLERGVDLLKNVMKARNVALMHYRLKRDLEEAQRLAAELRPHFGRVIVCTKPLETVTLSRAR